MILPSHALTASLLLAATLLLSLPIPAEASHTSSRSTSRERVSSSVQREINKLDDDEVEEIPIPILFGLQLSRIYSDFGDDRDGGSRQHEGQDLIAPRGTPIASPTDAVVTRTGNGSSSGITVTTRNPGGESFIYMHLDEIAEGVKTGTVLEPGDILGFVGDTGNAKGGVTHLHFEIRDGRKATDPYPRLEREFTLKERIDGVEAYLEELDSDDAEDWAEDLVTSWRSVFVQAKLAGMDLPEEIEEALGAVTAGVAADANRDLTLGSQGDDVIKLQVALIALDSGASARALAAAGSTGYFGAMTAAALVEYQRAEGIVPATGYYGSLTRARMAAEKP
ncbi:MAG: peptidoglycan DD-metalloendopeptidase family protein [Patescibacteria group bacterium]